MNETSDASRMEGKVWLSGQLGGDQSLRDVLEMMGTMKEGEFALLRILSKSVRGYLGIQNADIVTGAALTSTRDFGLSAMQQLFAAQKGIFLIMIMTELPQELRQDIGMSITDLLTHRPNEGLAEALESFAQANPDKFAMNEATAVAASGHDLVDFEAHMAWGDSGDTAKPKMTLSRITSSMTAPNADQLAASRAALAQSLEQEQQTAADLEQYKQSQQPDWMPPPAPSKPKPPAPSSSQVLDQLIAQKAQARDPQPSEMPPESTAEETPAEEKEKLDPRAKLLRKPESIHRDDAQSVSQKIRTLRAEEAHKLKPIEEDFIDDAPIRVASPAETRRYTLMMIGYGGLGLLLLIALGHQVFNITQAHAQYRSGIKALANKDDARAEVELTTALKLGATGSEAYLYRSIAETRLGHTDKAMSDLNQLVGRNGGNKIARITRATRYLASRDYTNAIADCDAVLKLDDTYLDAYRVKAIAECGAGNYKECIDDATTYIEATGDKPNVERARAEVLAARGYAYLKVKKYEQAIADYSEAIKLAPNNAHFYASRGVAYTKTKQWSEGVADADAAIKLDPSNAALYKLRGVCSQMAGHTDSAVSDMDTAAKMKPTPTAYRLRGHARLLAKNYVGALEDFEYLLSLNPNDKEAKREYDAAKLALSKGLGTPAKH